MPTSVKVVASALLYEADRMGIKDVSNMKLQKLLYDTQGYHLALFDERAFEEDIKAWPYGSVVEPIYHDYKHHQGRPIPAANECPSVPKEILASLQMALTGRGTKTAIELSKDNHAEQPWQEAWHFTKIIQRLINRFGSAKLRDSTMKTLFISKILERQNKARANAPDYEGDVTTLNISQWKELQARLAEPPSEALRTFMRTPSVLESPELDNAIRARLAHA